MIKSYESLSYREKLFVDCYLNDSLVEPTIHKHTYNDKLVSYIFAFNKGDELMECINIGYSYFNWATKSIESDTDYSDGCDVTITIKNAKKYLVLVKASTRIYNKTLQAINDIRYSQYDTNDKSKILELKDAIWNSSIHSNDSKDRNENRKMAMKIFGLDQVKVDMGLDIYEASGKNILKARKQDSDMSREDAPIVPDLIDDIIKDDGEDNG